MEPGRQRLYKRLGSKDYPMDEFLEDMRIVASDNPEMADIFRRMIQAELEEIKKEKERGTRSKLINSQRPNY